LVCSLAHNVIDTGSIPQLYVVSLLCKREAFFDFQRQVRDTQQLLWRMLPRFG